jgi:predicted signal transduction protein with EAL and GGDEF domain
MTSQALAAAVPEERLADVLARPWRTRRTMAQPRMLAIRDGITSRAHAPLRGSCALRAAKGGDVLVVRQDTSERTAAAQRIERLAFYDTLTAFPIGSSAVEMAVAMPHRRGVIAGGQSVAFMYVDLNGFKRINDTFGHSVGDTILQRVAKVLCSTLESFVRPGSRAVSGTPGRR